MNNKQRAWIAAATQSLQKVESWTGRIHLHKHLFVIQVLGLAEIPFEFELHHYGPYSFELDSDIAEMEAFGELDKDYPQPGYGPSYQLTGSGRQSLSELTSREQQAADDVAAKLADFDSSDLELIATCLWVKLRELENDPDLIVPRVCEIKPKYPRSRIRWALTKAEELRSSIS
jgi:uncharacterized protein YwgA